MTRAPASPATLVWIALAALAPLARPATADAASAPIRALEQAVETRSGALLLPDDGIGTVTVTPCSGCRPLGLLAGSSTTWMLGDRPVDFGRLRRVLRSGARVPVIVYYDGRNRALTRLVARVPAEAAP